MTLDESSRNISRSDSNGATSLKSIVETSPFASRITMKPPPPILPALGKVTPSANPTAIAASTAFPPFFNTSIPISDACKLDELTSLIERHIRKGAVGEFTLPGMMKIKTVKKPARKAKKGVPNPFKPGETMDVAAKPASTAVKILPLKGMKDFA